MDMISPRVEDVAQSRTPDIVALHAMQRDSLRTTVPTGLLHRDHPVPLVMARVASLAAPPASACPGVMQWFFRRSSGTKPGKSSHTWS